eukprot:CAMPEP_0169430710 /NCGR_PEP_ID=MMETSP1042-20121227/2544_1 /TAXON_ID=464988 /ORGANISM="Hemiselmis andersenii, Strain CCMP1180" /LENGTH=287 /DNA_ID=CAMNT_0009541043 /DNA_START=11 /DNA_END=874 /DNA_ORIENTATION=-
MAENVDVMPAHRPAMAPAEEGVTSRILVRRGLVVCTGLAAATAVAFYGGLDGGARGWASGGEGPKVVLSRELDLAQLPSFTAASQALRSSSGADYQDTAKDVLGKMQKQAHTDHALGNKALDKIIKAARAAALASNSKLREADNALAQSQKQLGGNAVHLKLLTGGETGSSADNGPLSGAQLDALIHHTMADKDAKKALAAAQKAAAKNKSLMQGARNILRDSAKVLGHDAVSIPPLARSKGTAGGEKPAQAAGSTHSAKEADQAGRREFLADRRFLSATKGAFMRP